ncbi:protein TALPID3 isoform X2 [Ctenopharyngodon idella]|uniref:protein TALPID3 isoform X2 n=1 Tax=Ctenopharyngodon idella TaxID=7959 RepID=UPI0022304124|nr:protein TALPID3 isoform X2 [Ctenopharyngodon idella]
MSPLRSDAADVLIHSTRAALAASREEIQHKSHNRVNIYIRRLSDSEHVHSEKEIPPVNIPSAADTAGPDEQQAVGPSNQFADLFDKASRKEKSKAQNTVMQTGNSKSKGEDVQISTYSADGREAVAAALRKRSQSAPLRRNVTVQVLGQDRSQTPRGQSDPAFPLGDPGTSASVAAVTAATIAATAPLIKAQSEMEAQIALVTAELRRLQAAEGSVPPGRAASTDNTSAGRAAHLEEQLNILIQQRLQHLETIQCQQIQLQNRLLGSALDVVAVRATTDSQSTVHTGSGITQTDSLPVQISGSRSIRLSATDKPSARGTVSVSKDVHREKQAGGHKSPLDTPAPRKVIPKPTHWTSSRSTIKPQRSSLKNQGNGRLQDQSPNNRRSPERCVVQSVGVKRFAMATADNGQPERSRTSQMPPTASAALTRSTQLEEPAFMNPQNEQGNHGEHIHVASSSSAVQRASQMLQDLGRLKNEMRSLLQTADAFPVQNAKSTQSSGSSHLAPSATAPPPSTTPISMPPEPVDVIAVRAAPLNRPSILKSIQPPTSMFEDAGLVLRQVRQSRKVLEENLEAILRAKDGEVLHTQLEALSKNRDVHEELRIKKTVDAWINTLSKEIQDELARENSERIVERSDAAVAKVVQQGQKSKSGREAGPRGGGRGRGGGEASAADKKTSLRGLVRTQAESTLAHSKQPTLSVRTKPEGKQETPVVLKSQDDQEYLARLYGKALYEGHRRTLKKSPYLRFNSPTPKSKPQRPKVVETVKGVKMKSSKTQTSQFVDGVPTLQPSVSEPHFLFSPSDPAQQQQPGSPVRGYLIPMAIPLGKPRVDGQAPVPSRVIISDKPATVTTSFPPITVPEPKPAPVIRKPNTILLEVQSERKKRTPQLKIQVQPAVNIESDLCSSPASSTPSIPAETILPPPSIHAAEEPNAGEDQEENIIPGTNFLAVADISQETLGGLPDSPIELNGLPSPPAALYHGPAFPPQPSQSTPLTEPILSTIQQRETLENRLVDWVEQQLMARMITGMFPQPTQTDPASQSEPENSVTSDIVEAAGGGGLQLFVDTGVPVDSELIRQCVNEVLAETVAVMLGQRETQRASTAPVQTQDTPEEVTVVPTPAPTPEPSLKEPPSPVSTPDLSEHLSMALSPKKNHQESASPGPDRIPVGTPTTTPIPSPTRVATPSPPPANQSPVSATLQHHPWGGRELPLEEEEEPHGERQDQQPESVVMSVVQEDDEEKTVIHLSSPLPSKQTTPPPPLPPVSQEPPPESSSSSSSSSEEESSSSSSVTVTETETPARHISEGELLLTHGQMAAVRVLEQEGVLLPNLMTSLNSSLHGVQDMDYDPPSEGQVIRAPRHPAHHDPVLSLLARMERGPVSQSQQQERWWEEESSGEVSEGQRPLLTAAEEIVLTGHSLIDQQRYTQPRTTEISPHATLTSPGQVLAEHTGAVVENSGLSVNLRSSEEQKEAEVYHVMTVSSPQDTEHQSPQTAQTVHRPVPILVRQYEDKEEPEFPQLRRLSDDTFFGDNEKGEDIFLQTEGGGRDVRVMSVRLPSVKQDQESVSLSSVEGDTDFSANDVF